jgi:hypothetical protein
MRREPVSPDFCDYVESLMYELDARRDLCAFMVDHGMSETEHFEKYHDAYLKANAEYAIAKGELTKMAGSGKKWWLDFDNRELVIEDAE